MTRRSPIHHIVHSHKRQDGEVRVQQYERGHGKKPKAVIGAPRRGGGSYRVTVSGGGRSDSHRVMAGGLVEALDSGLGQSSVGAPRSVTIRRT